MIEHDAQRQRFSLERAGETAHLDYRTNPGSVDFTHTWTPTALRGQGIAAQLVAAGVSWARAEKLQIHASCSYVIGWLARKANEQSKTN